MKAAIDDEIKDLRQLKWKTYLTKRIEEFSEIVSDDDVFERYFGKSYVEKLASKSRKITKNSN